MATELNPTLRPSRKDDRHTLENHGQACAKEWLGKETSDDYSVVRVYDEASKAFSAIVATTAAAGGKYCEDRATARALFEIGFIRFVAVVLENNQRNERIMAAAKQ